jgi:hypothetical protein
MIIQSVFIVALSEVLEDLAAHPDCCYDVDDLREVFAERCTIAFGDANRTLVTEDAVWRILEDIDQLPSAVIKVTEKKFSQLMPVKYNGTLLGTPYIDISN